MQRQTMMLCQIAYELLIRIGLGTANLMVHVDRCKHQPQLFAQLQQKTKQGHGISAAGNRHSHAVAGPQQFLFANVAAYALGEVVHRSIVRQKQAAFIGLMFAGAPRAPAVARRTSPVTVNRAGSSPK